LVSGLVLAVDLALWHESIALVGAGLGTVIANVQVVFVALAAWLLFDERLTTARVGTIVAVLGGVALTSGLARHDAYGSNPVAGAVIGLIAGVCYSVFILVYRQPHGASLAGAARRGIAGDRVALDRPGAAGAASGGDLNSAARPADLHRAVGRGVLRRAAVGAAMARMRGGARRRRDAVGAP